MYEQLYRTAPVGLCLLDTELRFVRINERLAAINGKSVKEHIGHSLAEVIPDVAREHESVYRRVFETGEPVFDLEVTTSTSVWTGTALVSHFPVKTAEGTVIGVSTVVQGITDHKQAEQALRENEQRYRQLVETMNEGLGITVALRF